MEKKEEEVFLNKKERKKKHTSDLVDIYFCLSPVCLDRQNDELQLSVTNE